MIMQPIEDFDEEIVGDDDDYETGNGNYRYHIKLLLNMTHLTDSYIVFTLEMESVQAESEWNLICTF